jgi:hypothetical protein
LREKCDVRQITDGQHEAACSDNGAKNFVLSELLKNQVDVTLLRPSGSTLQHRFLQLLQHEELSDD